MKDRVSARSGWAGESIDLIGAARESKSNKNKSGDESLPDSSPFSRHKAPLLQARRMTFSTNCNVRKSVYAFFFSGFGLSVMQFGN